MGIAVDKAADYNSTICRWIRWRRDVAQHIRATSTTDGLGLLLKPIHLDRPQGVSIVDWAGRKGPGDDCSRLGRRSIPIAMLKVIAVSDRVVSTDPPYYDNIGYADLSDFFYVWLRRSLKPSSPTLRHARRAEGRGAGRHALPPRRQGEGRGLLPRRHDAGDAPSGRAGAPGLPRHHLLRLQAVGERER